LRDIFMPEPVTAAPPMSPTLAATGPSEPLWPKVLRAAWLAIGLGILLEVLVLMLAAFTGTAGESGRPALADLAQRVSWSFLVCVGLAFGAAIKKVREIAMGGIGLFAAPAAFAAAKAVHKGLGQALGV